MKDFIRYVETNQLGDLIYNVSFKNLTSLKMGGTAAVLFEPKDVGSLANAYQYIKEHQVPYFVIGNGTNLLVSDEMFQLVLIRLSNINEIEDLGNGNFAFSAGAKSMAIGRAIAKLGYTGSEFMAMIPGTIGGLIYMNGGAYKRSVADCLYACDYIDANGTFHTLTSGFEFSYRSSIFQKNDGIIVKGYFHFEKSEDPAMPLATINRYLEMKKKTQPLKEPNAGSTFQNPEDRKAWEVVDALGYRGYRIGDCEVSPLHANFIVNKENAKFEDMCTLIQKIQKDAKEKLDVDLKCEWKFLKN